MSELRQDAWSGEWIAFSDRRQSRPVETGAAPCPLCPDESESHEVHDADWDVMVFENRFPGLGGAAEWPQAHGEYVARAATGHTEVVLYSPQHDAELADLGPRRIRQVVDVWADRTTCLARDPQVQTILIFENRGHAAGATVEHPHGQIYAYPFVPSRTAQQMRSVAAFARSTGLCLGCEVIAREIRDGSRLLFADDNTMAHVPFAPRFPYEVNVLVRRHVRFLADLTAAERDALAEAMCEVIARYDGLFGIKLPYVMVIHQPPVRGPLAQVDTHLRIAFLPPHRTANRLKVIAGSELGAGAFLTDVLPEVATQRLRGVT